MCTCCTCTQALVEDGFMFFQLPDCLPVNASTTELNGSNLEGEVCFVTLFKLPYLPYILMLQESRPKTAELATLNLVPEGRIGKLKIHKSGKTR